MTFGDLVILGLLGGCTLYLRHLWQQDVEHGRAQRHPVPYPGWFHAVFGLIFGSIAAGMLWFGVQNLLTPGITEIDSGRLRGLDVHHRVMGVAMVSVGAGITWLTWIVAGGFVTERMGRRSPPPPVRTELPGPSLQAARSTWQLSSARLRTGERQFLTTTALARPPRQTALGSQRRRSSTVEAVPPTRPSQRNWRSW